MFCKIKHTGGGGIWVFSLSMLRSVNVCDDHLQEFINNHTKYYEDEYHAYSIGLHQKEDEQWIWIDGRIETEG